MYFLRFAIAGLTLLACLYAAGAHAAITEDTGRISACLDAAKGDDGRQRACIDTVAGPCLKQPGGESTPGTVDCITNETYAWDKILNEEYGRLLPLLKKEAAEDVRQAQRLWLQVRDADCRVPYYFYDGGTIVKVLGAECVRNHTVDRALMIKSWREMAQGE